MLVLACVVVALIIAVMVRRWWVMGHRADTEGSAGSARRPESPPATATPAPQSPAAQSPAPPAAVDRVPVAPPPASTASAPGPLEPAGFAGTDGGGGDGAAILPSDPAWSEARRLRAALLAQEVPAQIQAWELVPEPGEVFFYDLTAVHERFYGQDVRYERTGAFLLGSPAFLLAGLAVSGAVNASRQRAAEAQAATQWRDRELTRVVATNHRLLVLVRGQWLSFHYRAMTAVYPEVADRTLVVGFESIPPLRLSGVDAPILAVMTLFMTHGAVALRDHPALRALD